jgi:hypothetical protein
MARRDINTNIMLDLECGSISHPNPVLLELAAVYFDLNTGAELACLSTPISYQSCLDAGLMTSEDTVCWLEDNIPQTLQASKDSQISLQQALFKFSNFVRASHRTTIETLHKEGNMFSGCQPKIWGNGAVADNVWIKSAYEACDMERPWKFYNDMCVRTFVSQMTSILGKNFARDSPQIGVKHVALDDCRHQISYLVKARNMLISKMQCQCPDHALGFPRSSHTAKLIFLRDHSNCDRR